MVTIYGEEVKFWVCTRYGAPRINFLLFGKYIGITEDGCIWKLEVLWGWHFLKLSFFETEKFWSLKYFEYFLKLLYFETEKFIRINEIYVIWHGKNISDQTWGVCWSSYGAWRTSSFVVESEETCSPVFEVEFEEELGLQNIEICLGLYHWKELKILVNCNLKYEKYFVLDHLVQQKKHKQNKLKTKWDYLKKKQDCLKKTKHPRVILVH